MIVLHNARQITVWKLTVYDDLFISWYNV